MGSIHPVRIGEGPTLPGTYIDPTSSRVPVRVFADSWLRSKQPPMSKPSYCMTLERARKNHVAPA